jgi:hypothetical protein
MEKFHKLLSITAIISSSFIASSSIASTEYSIVLTDVKQLFSSTFDGLNFTQSVTNTSDTFFGDVPNINNPQPGINRSIGTDKNGEYNGSGSITIAADGTSLEALNLTLPDLTMTILTGASELTVETSGAALQIVDIPNGDGGKLSLNNTVLKVDFSSFNNIAAGDTNGPVLSCTDSAAGANGGFCGLLPNLSLDGFRYKVVGDVANSIGTGSVILQVQTTNKSYYEVQMVIGGEVIDNSGGSKNVPAMGTFGLIALFAGLIGVSSRLRKK